MYSPAQVAALLCFMFEQLQEERVLEIVVSGLRIEFQLDYLHLLCNDQTMSSFFFMEPVIILYTIIIIFSMFQIYTLSVTQTQPVKRQT